jgi:CheY-like chemotaxis protein
VPTPGSSGPDVAVERFSGVRALVAEDQDINREIVVELLEQRGIETDYAENGRAAVEMVRRRDYDIVFMDIQMPELDGIAATKEIRSLAKAASDRLPIIALSGCVLTDDRMRSLAAGMNDHLAKTCPCSPVHAGQSSCATNRPSSA